MRKVFIGIAIVAVVVIGFVVVIFYIAFRPKFKDVSDVPPFVEIVNTRLTTKRETLMLEYPAIPQDQNYAFHLEDGTAYGMDSDLPILARLPVGTEITIDKVEMHTGRVSGITSVYIFGKVYSQENQPEYTFQYTWGEYHFIYQEEPYWTFEKAFWQTEALEGKFYIEVP